jgi:hypothetical protein
MPDTRSAANKTLLQDDEKNCEYNGNPKVSYLKRRIGVISSELSWTATYLQAVNPAISANFEIKRQRTSLGTGQRVPPKVELIDHG